MVIVPGLAVRRYALPAAAALARSGCAVSLLRPPAWRGAPTDLTEYGVRLAERLDARGEEVEVLIGLSVGSQAAAVAATRTDRIRGLVLVSPTVDPVYRGPGRLLRRWLGGSGGDEAPPLRIQMGDWARAGPFRIAAGYASALRVRLEAVVPHLRGELVVVHGGRDALGSAAWAAELARLGRGRLIELPDAPHSWPVGDEVGFVRLVRELCR